MTVSGGRAAGEAERIEREAVAQFTVHAEAFARAAVVNDERALDVLADLAAVGPGHRVVDVACGPGIVTCRLAAGGASVVGVDLTPAMLGLAVCRLASFCAISRLRCLFCSGELIASLRTARSPLQVAQFAQRF